jgi:hypothetical protein
MYVIEKIISHRGNKKKPHTLKFEVKWKELSMRETSMESYENIKDNQALHDYLNALGGSWSALVPIEFTEVGEHYTEKRRSA